jgi:glycine/D-amino acid oxidase-like deaminating enzyme
MHQHQSIWAATVTVPEFPPLASDLRVDVCGIGAGIAGLTTAYLLTLAGKSVAVLDDGPIGGGMTQMTTGHVTNMLDDRYFELEKLYGVETTRLAAQSHTAAIDQIEGIVQAERIDCDFERLDGYLFLAQGDKKQTLEDEPIAGHRTGLTGVAKREHSRVG